MNIKKHLHEKLCNKDFNTVKTLTLEDYLLFCINAIKQSNTIHRQRYLLIGFEKQTSNWGTNLFHFYSIF